MPRPINTPSSGSISIGRKAAQRTYDRAINKAKLKKNGVRVLPARENITEDASGILIEGVLETMAE